MRVVPSELEVKMSSKLSFLGLRMLTLTLFVCAALCATAAAQTAEAAADASPSKTSPNAITGQVVNEAGQPITNATVLLSSLNSPAPARPVPAASDGTFVFAGLGPGIYTLTATAPSYVPFKLDSRSTPPEYHHVGDSVKITMVKGGVISGTVTDASGEPVVAVRVRAAMVRDARGETAAGVLPVERLTDDRGVFRLYGLAPGTYVVSAGGRDSGGTGVGVAVGGGGFRGGGRGGGFGGGFGGAGGGGFGGPATAVYDRDAPTFAPASSRDTATEFVVSEGVEVSGADIKYRGERGHSVGGVVKSAAASKGAYAFSVVTLARAHHEGEVVSTTTTRGAAFAFYGVADGEYELTAQTALGSEGAAVSRPLRVVVSGANVSGLIVNTNPLASLAGRVTLEETSAPECKDKHRPRFEEILVSARRDDADNSKEPSPPPQFSIASAAPGRDGSFLLDRLGPGRYRLDAGSFAKYWYVRSITLPPPAPAAVAPGRGRPAAPPPTRAFDAAREGVALKFGTRVRDLTITLAEGAASLRGRVAVGEGEKPPAGLFVYLVPAEKDQGENVLRFFAAPVADDGGFALINLAPGLYRALARAPIDAQEQSKLRTAEGREARASLRREAEGAKTSVELKPCQNVVDFPLPFAPAMPRTN